MSENFAVTFLGINDSDGRNVDPMRQNLRIIGIEVTLRASLLSAQELYMFIPPAGRDMLPPADIHAGREFIITFHTSRGDFQGRIPFRG